MAKAFRIPSTPLPAGLYVASPRLAYHIQAMHIGDLSKRARNKLKRLALQDFPQMKPKFLPQPGGGPLNKSVLYRILKCPLYIGQITHKDKTYPGQHEAIITGEAWNQVQALLETQTAERSTAYIEHGTLLRGKCFDAEGRRYTTTYSVKNKTTHHRYYENRHTGHRIRGDNLEQIVFDAILYVCNQPEFVKGCFTGDHAILPEEEAHYRLQKLWAVWDSLTEITKHDISQQIVERVTILPDAATIRISYAGLNTALNGIKIPPIASSTLEKPDVLYTPRVLFLDDGLEITLSVIFKVKGRIKQAFTENGKAFEIFSKTQHDMTLINALGKAYNWDQMIKFENYTPDRIAAENQVSKGYISTLLRLTLLSPRIVEAILDGRQPKHLQLKELLRPFPNCWDAQEKCFMFQ